MNREACNDTYDAIVIGGGFYGCSVALFLAQHFSRVLILEREDDLLQRASYVNQARVHNGYHYPRSFITALRSHINFPQFTRDFNDCVDSSFEKVYAIARNSKVNAFQFRRVFEDIGAPISLAPSKIKKLFDSKLIEEVFTVEEYAFDSVKLCRLLKAQLSEAGVEVWCNTQAQKLAGLSDEKIRVHLSSGTTINAQYVFNCTYAALNQVLNESGLPLLPLKHEVAEIALVEVPDELKQVGVTVMDGPFFSVMPFPARGLHSLSHVRYTPHESWSDLENYRDSYKHFQGFKCESKAIFMLKDSQRYLPILREAKHVDSLFDLKTVLVQNEVDDGRPILYRRDYGIKNLSLVMGGKIDNIYDILETLKNSFAPSNYSESYAATVQLVTHIV
ncbi:MAG TPA: FAD-dependent oxidoreductase [Blastocatellia bacterium]|nr:FAD-dependent oxidoreductase [Blastocatellia bacterium]